MMEAVFKDETVGLVTREEFLSKKNTLQDRMDEAKAQARRDAASAADQVGRLVPGAAALDMLCICCILSLHHSLECAQVLFSGRWVLGAVCNNVQGSIWPMTYMSLCCAA